MAAPATTTRDGAAGHQPQHVVGRGAHRAPHREVGRALLHRIRQDAEHADHRQHQRQAGEGHHQHRAEAMRRGGLAGDVVEGLSPSRRSRVAPCRCGRWRPAPPAPGTPRRRWPGAPAGTCRRARPGSSARTPARGLRSRRAGPSPGGPRRRSRARPASAAARWPASVRRGGRSDCGHRGAASRTPRSRCRQTGFPAGRSARTHGRPRPADRSCRSRTRSRSGSPPPAAGCRRAARRRRSRRPAGRRTEGPSGGVLAQATPRTPGTAATSRATSS